MINLLIYRLFGTCVLFSLWLNTSYSQIITGPVGAEQWMLGGTSAAVNNVWSVTNNAATITQTKKITGGLYTEQRFAESHFQFSNASVVVPTKYVHIGFAINHFGYSAFNQQRIVLSVAKQLSPIFSLGVQLNYISTQIQDYGSAGNPVLGLGLYAKPLSKLNLAFVVFNPTQNTYSKHTTDKIPTYARLGINYSISEKLILHTEADQQLNSKLLWRLGVQYKIHDIVQLAMGAATSKDYGNTYYTFGSSFLLKKVNVDIAISIHQVIGLTPHIGIALPVTP